MTEESFRLTFNRPAGVAHLENMTGLRLALVGRSIRFLPVADYRRHDDAVQISKRGGDDKSRGGYECHITGANAATILKRLQRLSTPEQPFFILHKAVDGWLDIVHFDNDKNPPKFDPHMRLWTPRLESSMQRRQRIAAERKQSLASLHDPSLLFARRIISAAKIISEYEKGRRIGRPPVEVVDAQNVMAFFSNLIHRVKPSLAVEDKVDWPVLRQAHSLLGQLIAMQKAGPITDTLPEPPKSLLLARDADDDDDDDDDLDSVEHGDDHEEIKAIKTPALPAPVKQTDVNTERRRGRLAKIVHGDDAPVRRRGRPPKNRDVTPPPVMPPVTPGRKRLVISKTVRSGRRPTLRTSVSMDSVDVHVALADEPRIPIEQMEQPDLIDMPRHYGHPDDADFDDGPHVEIDEHTQLTDEEIAEQRKRRNAASSLRPRAFSEA